MAETKRMNLIEWVLSFVRSPRNIYVPSVDPFRRLDVDELRRRLKPGERGAASGRDELPASEAVAPDRWEADIVAACAEELAEAHVRVLRGVDTLLASIRDLSPESAISQVRQIRDRASAGLHELAVTGRGRLRGDVEYLNAIEEDFRAFRQREGLQRPAAQPDRLWRWAVLLAMVVVETVFNGNMFAQGNDYGLLGGFLLAGTLSCMNVGWGVLSGWLPLPQLYHRQVWRKVVGTCGILVAAGVAVVFNVAVAQFRDASVLGLATTEAAARALQRLQSTPFALADLMSWLLLAGGLVFWGIAAADGLGMDDPYPGYGRRYRALRQARDEWHTASQEVRERLSSTLNAAVDQIQALVMQANLYGRHRAALADKLERQVGSYESHVRATRRVFQDFIEEYREANRRARTTPAPAYFKELAMPNAEPAPSAPVSAVSAGLAAEAESAVASLTLQYKGHVRELTPIMDAEGGDV